MGFHDSQILRFSQMSGLYAITDPTLLADEATLIHGVREAIAGGTRWIQYRDKTSPPKVRHKQASMLVSICHEHGARLVINDDLSLAMDVGADGVHLGQSDEGLREARRRAGPDFVIGITCHNSLRHAEVACELGADYVAFGRFFDSKTKPEAPMATLETLTEAKNTLPIPIVAIGGINKDNAFTVLERGADMIAVIHGIFGQPVIKQAAGELTEICLQFYRR